jgi:two-component system chemotaxis response regulator CheB
MQECPCPIVMASASLASDDVHPGLEALREGALVIVAKPLDPMASNFDVLCRELRLSLRLMSEIRVVRRVPPRQAVPRKPPARRIAIVAIGASTGGPPVILDLLRRLAPDLDVPIVVVQHMAPGFVTGFASWLERGSGLPVVLAGDGDAVRPSHVYVAPEHRHIEVDGRGRLSLDDGPAEGGFRPSINRLFRSVGEAYGPAAIAVLLTGMGDDGAEGMAVVARRGGITVAQDAETSVVFGMPAAAVRLGAVQHLLPPAEIARFVAEQVSRKSLST